MDHHVQTATAAWQQVLLVFSVQTNADGTVVDQLGYSWIEQQQLREVHVKPDIFSEDNGALYGQDID